MDNKKNYIDLSKYNTKPTNNDAPEEPVQRSFLADLFKENPDTVQAAADRARRFGRTPTNNPDQKGSFFK